MNRIGFDKWMAGVVLVCLQLGGYAENNTPYIYSNSTVFFAGGFIIGTSGTNNYVEISYGGSVTNAHMYLGNSGDRNSGLVTGSNAITGAKSVWQNNSFVFIGYYANSNTLTIADGGQFRAPDTYVGRFGSNNTAVITGSGSAWSNTSYFYVGYGDAAGNLATITNGGTVYTPSSLIIGNDSGSTSNKVVVADGGFLYAAAFYMGNYGSGNQLVVSSGGLHTWAEAPPATVRWSLATTRSGPTAASCMSAGQVRPTPSPSATVGRSSSTTP
jgi:T5SS/PEP-CTERM-associated repeat protein